MSASDEVQDKLIMKHGYPFGSTGLRAQRTTGMILLVTGLLCACATEKPRKEEAALNKPVAVVAAAEMTSEVRADFDAAMVHIKAEEYDAAVELLTKVVKAVPNAAVPNIDL